MILQVLQNTPKEQQQNLLDEFVVSMGELAFCSAVAEQMVAAIRPERALPKSLSHFMPLVTRGLTFFLSRISSRRLRKVISELSARHPVADMNERLFHLALQFPTLHKLGQIIARNPGVDPRIKIWLIQLEQGTYGVNMELHILKIKEQLADIPEAQLLTISPKIIAEASAAVVILFTNKNAEGAQPSRGVFKILKQDIGEKLKEELQVIEKTAVFLEKSRHELGLQDMRVSTLFKELRADLEKEIDLTAEQEKLAEAAGMYRHENRVRIPKILPFCSATMTAMEFIEGIKVTEVEAPPKQLASLAGLVFESIICQPLFSQGDYALFHGDPHAGNILAVPGKPGSIPDIALIDWALAGYLSKNQRIFIMQLLLGVVKADSRVICSAITRLTGDTSKAALSDTSLLQERISEIMTTPAYLACDPLKKSFSLMEQVTLQGLVFPSEMILYRKAFFTLEGVLNDISPGFSMGEYMELYLSNLLIQELPFRYGAWCMPFYDSASVYRTMLTNYDLHDLIICQAFTHCRKVMDDCSALVEANMNIATDFYSFFSGSRKYSVGG